MNPDNTKDNTKKRIRVACDSCRRKKIKCDGSYPCGNCSQSKGQDCIYKERPERKVKQQKIPKRVSNAKTIEILDTRLSKLESAILNIADKLDPDSGRSGPFEHTKTSAPQNEDTADENGEVTATDDGDDDDDDDDEEDEDEDEDEDDEEEPGLGCMGGPRKDHTTSDKGKAKKSLLNNHLEQYFGAHSVMCIFSDKSSEWIEKSLRPEDTHLIIPIRNLPFVFHREMKNFLAKWVDPPIIDAATKKKLLERPFPENKRMVLDFLDNYYDTNSEAKHLCDFESVRELFENYYNVNGKKPKRLKHSELLIMSAALCLCISCKIDDDTACSSPSTTHSKPSTPDTIKSMSNDELTVLQDELFSNCVFYYQRISVFSDGIETVQAILLLIIYIESSWITSHVNYMLISVAVRFAQEIGLHRFEAFHNLSKKESAKRRKIWWFCYYLDMEICFRSGKPPLINTLDVSTHSERDLCTVFSPYSSIPLTSDEPLQLNSSILKILEQNSVGDGYFHYYLLLLTKIRANSYNTLFAASAQNQSFEDLSDNLDSLNRETLKIGDLMDPVSRPRFYNDPEFYKVDEICASNNRNILTVQFTYFLHLMVINRLPFSISDVDHTCVKSLEFRNLSLDSARTILVLAKKMKRDELPLSFFNWIVFFPVAAFTNLSASCLNHPEAPETYGDIQLLVDISMNFFSKKMSVPVEGFSRFKIYGYKDTMVALIVNVLLRVVIRVFENKTNISLLENNASLKQHLESAQIIFPDLFKDPKEFVSQFNSNLDTSPFGSQGFFKIGGDSPFTMDMNTKNGNLKSPAYNRVKSSLYSEDNFGERGRRKSSISQFSNSLSPDLSNILHPPFNDKDNSLQEQSGFLNNYALSDQMNDDGLSSMIYSQMNNLPNFFFDNNLGI